ncbi:major facilitator superfamily domain-containing protein [Schizophyllum commune]
MDVPTLTKTKTTEAAVVETPVDEKAPTPVSEKVPGVTDLESSGTDEEEWTYPDGGWRAWGVAFGCFLLGATGLGWGFTWGIFQSYYQVHVFPSTPVSVLGLAGGLMSFACIIATLFAGRLGDKYGYRRMIILSCFLTWAFMFGSAFCTTLVQVFIVQCAATGAAIGLGTPMYMALPSQWFLKKRGLATGMVGGGTGIGSAVATLILRQLITTVGNKKTLIIYSFIHGFFYIIACLLIRERRPPVSRAAQAAPAQSTLATFKAYLTDLRFWSFTLCLIVLNFGYLLPVYYVPQYTAEKVPSLDPNSLTTAVPTTLLNLAGGLGRIFVGWAADVFGTFNVFFVSVFLGGVLQLVCWLFAENFASIIVFAILWGIFAGCFLTLLPVMCAEMWGIDNLATMTGIMMLMIAPGQLSGGAVGGAIFDATGGSWTALIVYGGVMMTVGSFFILPLRFSKDKRIFAKA